MSKSVPKTSSPKAPVEKSPESSQLIDWFEIPALNFERACSFYNHLFQTEMSTSEVNGYLMALLPHEDGAGGAVVFGEGSTPSEHGPLLYLNAGDNMDGCLQRIEEAGGKVILGKTFISDDSGHFAIFMDSEGNKLALHSK